MSWIPTSHCVESQVVIKGPECGGRQPLSVQFVLLLEETLLSCFPFPPIDRARALVSYDPGNRVTLIWTPSPALHRAAPPQLPYIHTPTTYLPLAFPAPSLCCPQEPSRGFGQTSKTVTRHAFRGYYRIQVPTNVSLPKRPSFPASTPLPRQKQKAIPYASWNEHTRPWNTILPAHLITCDTSMRDTPGL